MKPLQDTVLLLLLLPCCSPRSGVRGVRGRNIQDPKISPRVGVGVGVGVEWRRDDDPACSNKLMAALYRGQISAVSLLKNLKEAYLICFLSVFFYSPYSIQYIWIYLTLLISSSWFYMCAISWICAFCWSYARLLLFCTVCWSFTLLLDFYAFCRCSARFFWYSEHLSCILRILLIFCAFFLGSVHFAGVRHVFLAFILIFNIYLFQICPMFRDHQLHKINYTTHENIIMK